MGMRDDVNVVASGAGHTPRFRVRPRRAHARRGFSLAACWRPSPPPASAKAWLATATVAPVATHAAIVRPHRCLVSTWFSASQTWRSAGHTVCARAPHRASMRKAAAASCLQALEGEGLDKHASKQRHTPAEEKAGEGADGLT